MGFSSSIVAKGQEIDILEIINSLKSAGYEIGGMNEDYSFKTLDEYSDTLEFVKCYKKGSIGRGLLIDFSYVSYSLINLQLNLPTATQDIKDYFTIASLISTKYNTPIFLDDENNIIEHDDYYDNEKVILNLNKQLLSMFLENGTNQSLPLVFFIKTFSEEEIENLKNGDHVANFDKFINDIQTDASNNA